MARTTRRFRRLGLLTAGALAILLPDCGYKDYSTDPNFGAAGEGGESPTTDGSGGSDQTTAGSPGTGGAPDR